MDSILMCEGRGASRPCSCLFALVGLAACAWGVRRRLGDIILFAFLSGSRCLFLIYRWLWGLIPVSSVVVGREPFTCFEN